MYSTISQPRAPFFATKLLPKFHTCRGRVPGLSASHFAPVCENAEESTSGLNSSLIRFTYWGIKFFSTAIFRHQNWWAKNRGKTPKIGKHETDLPGQTKKSLGLWYGLAQFHLMKANKSAGRFAGLHSSVLASFRFTRQSIQCIGQAGEQTGRRANRPGRYSGCSGE